MSLVSIKTGRSIMDVSADDPHGFALGLGKAVLGQVGAKRFYEGITLDYRTLYVWFKHENLMITLQTNSQPAADEDKLHELLGNLYEIVRHQAH
jgi:D-alanyl-D-alanine carboxypeptidase